MDMDGDQSLVERGNPESIAQVATDEGIIEGGSVSDFQEYKWEPEKKHRAETARYLAYGLVGILALTILIQYGMTVVLICQNRENGVATLEKLFSTLLPVLSGLVSGAATYYFTREKDA
ncbi:MAG: hypothetical protein ABR991_12600 [Terracidiphilus sp.]|jgi:hypothetical protein